MGPNLRQRNRLAAIRRIVDTALDLFDQRGYRAVTVEEIAAAADVSPRTFYRYFGTKEGLFTTDIHAAAGVDLLADHVDPADLPGSLRRVVEAIATAADAGSSWRGMRYVIEEPAVRSAVYLAVDHFGDRLAAVLRAGGVSPANARVISRTVLSGVYLGSLEQWHLDGRRRPLADYLQEAFAALHEASGTHPS